jgi:uncharacterized protein YbjT (DUF2867 family)
MRVLVTGGTGFIGREIVKGLVSQNHVVTVLARRPVTVPDGVLIKRGSILDATSLKAAMVRQEAVLHLVGIITEAREQTYERVHTQGTANVLETANAAGVQRWVQMSALGTRLKAVARYHQSKWAAEELVRNNPIPWTIHRPSLVHGPGDGFINLFNKIASFSPCILLPGGGKNLLQPVTVHDVAQCFIRCLTSPSTLGRTYDVCGADRLTMRRAIEILLEVTHRRRLILPLATELASVPARLGEIFYPAITGHGPPLNMDQLRMLAEDNVGDPEAMKRDMGIIPLPFKQALQEWLITPVNAK